MKPMHQSLRIGHIVPFSNTVYEPLISLINYRAWNQISHHMTRVRVVKIKNDIGSFDQFVPDTMVAASKLLADAHVDSIVWGGTSGSWIGENYDIRLCQSIFSETGIPACTASGALQTILRKLEFVEIGLVLPYSQAICARIANGFTRRGFLVTKVVSLGLEENLDIGDLQPSVIRNLIRSASFPRSDCIVVVCTNLRALPLIEGLERELGLPIVDSIAASYLEALRMAGGDVGIVKGLGRMFRPFG